VENPCREAARRGVKNQRQMVVIQFEPRMDSRGRSDRKRRLPRSIRVSSCSFVVSVQLPQPPEDAARIHRESGTVPEPATHEHAHGGRFFENPCFLKTH
jgi:hypothetical protein